MAKPYKPPRVNVSSYSSIYGVGTIKVGKSQVALIFRQNTKDGLGKKVQITLKKDNCPPWVKNQEVGFTGGPYSISLNEDKDQMTNIKPYQGMYTVKVKEFASAEGESPSPKTKEGSKDGKTWTYEQFTPILEIISGEESGMTVPYNLRFSQYGKPLYVPFLVSINDKEIEVIGHPNITSKYLIQLDEFEEASGLWNKGPIPYQENPLPLFEKRILGENKKFMVTIKKGWVDSIYQELQDDFADDSEDDLDTETEKIEAIEKELEFSDGADFDEDESPEDEEMNVPWDEDEEDSEDAEFSEFE